MLEDDRQEQVPDLDAVLLDAFDKSLRAPEPAAGGCHLSPDREIHAEPQRSSGSGERVACVEARVMQAFQEREVVVHAADHRGGGRQQLKLFAAERVRLIDVRE
ncbi:MAG: hypothetical protein ACREVB_17390, partial [Burkholderiales bacterium]